MYIVLNTAVLQVCIKYIFMKYIHDSFEISLIINFCGKESIVFSEVEKPSSLTKKTFLHIVSF